MPGSVQVSSSTPSPTRRIFSRITSPFTNTSKTVPEFFVQADDPHRRYAPGDLVSGTVVVKILKPVRITHIIVCLHGFVQVFKSPGSPPAEGFRAYNNLLSKGRGKKGGEYFGNGFATLFEDEAVVCGDGRLSEGIYTFHFNIRFPAAAMPSSIDVGTSSLVARVWLISPQFERGTISYMLSATMTRPTTMSPIVYHDQKIYYSENIDVARYLPPNPRTITLEPLLRTKGKSPAKQRSVISGSANQGSDGTTIASTRQSSTTPTPSTPAEDNVHRSSSPSIQSLDSQQSSDYRTSISGSNVHSSRASERESTSGPDVAKSRNITAVIQSLRGGCLRGDYIPVKISIDHTKYIKSMHGIIVTLYRQARVDTHPVLPLGPMSDSENRKREDYYPKSVTGLGGLSLSGAGSSHVFRKDLAQVIMPLIVDPRSLTAEITAKVRVPEECFPTITCVPGSMISFKYYIEVVVDIQGKLAGGDRYFAQAGSNEENIYGSPPEGDEYSTTLRTGPPVAGARIVDTAPIRRDRSVISSSLEVIVGTRDSDRKKLKAKAQAMPEEDRSETSIPTPTAALRSVTTRSITTEDATQTSSSPSPYNHRDEGPYFAAADSRLEEPGDNPALEFVAPPAVNFDGEGLTEKERIRRAEAALLPSQPPGMQVSTSEADASSAPYLEDSYPQPLPHWDDLHLSQQGPPPLFSTHSITSDAPQISNVFATSGLEVLGHRGVSNENELHSLESAAQASILPEASIVRHPLAADAEAGASETQQDHCDAPIMPRGEDDVGVHAGINIRPGHTDDSDYAFRHAVASDHLPRYER